MMGMRHILVLLVVGSSGTYACYEEFNEMYWTRNQCEDVFDVTMDEGQDVQDCVALCTMQSNCTSLNYYVDLTGKKCDLLLNCNAAKPEGFDVFIAFKKNVTVYKAHQSGKFWPSSQCPYVKTVYVASLETCKTDCNSNSNCTAIHYKSSTSGCELKNCPIPAPEPTGSLGGWMGYSIYPGYDEFNDKYWSAHQCEAPLPETKTMNASQDMQDCVALCTIQSNCNSVHYWVDIKGKYCELLNCNDNIPTGIDAYEMYAEPISGKLAFKKLGPGIEPVCKPTNICKKRGGTCMANYCPCDGFIVARGCKGGKNCKCCAPTRPIRCRTNRRCRNSGGKCKPITELEACNGTNGTMINHKCQGKRCGCCIPN